MKNHLAIVKCLSILVLLTLLSCAGLPSPDPGTLLAGASRSDCRGVPFVRLRGGAYQVGYQYGVLLSAELREVQGEFLGLLDAVLGKGPKRWLAEAVLESSARSTLAALPDSYAAELRGVADGSGQSFRSILILAMTPELLFDVNCSSFVTKAWGPLIHARNFDFYYPGSGVSRHPLVARYEIDGKIPFVNVGFVGLFGAYTGSNDRGMSATEDTAVFTRKPGGTCVPVGYALRMVLESSTSLGDARSILGPLKAKGYLITVSSVVEGEASVFELVNGHTTETRMSGDHIYVTNRCLSEENRRDNSLLLADFDVNLAREAALKAALASGRSWTSDDPAERARMVLADRSYGGLLALPPQQSLLQDAMRTVNNYSTIQSCVIDPMAKVVHVSWGTGYAASGEFLQFDLEHLLPSPSFPAEELLSTPGYLTTRDFVDSMQEILLKKGFAFTLADYRAYYPKVLEAGLPDLPQAEWNLAFAARLEDWPRVEAEANRIGVLLPDSYSGPFWQGLAVLRQGRAAEARDSLVRAAATPGLSPCADFIIQVYLHAAYRDLGDLSAAMAAQARADAILGRYRYTEKLAAILGTYFSDPYLKEAVTDSLKRTAVSRMP